jgi:hypothetical protein
MPAIPASLARRAAQATRQNRRAFQDLKVAIASHRALAFVGAGLSMNVKMPGWDELLESLSKLAVKAHAISSKEAGLVLELKEPLWVAGYLKSKLRKSSYAAFMQNTFSAMEIPREAEKLLRLFIKLRFDHFLTTNYDDVLEKAHRKFLGRKLTTVDWGDTRTLNNFVRELGASAHALPSRHCVHLHGIATDAESLVLSEREYLDRYVRSAETYRKLLAIFAARPLVFVGFGMKDADLMRILRDVQATLTTTKPKHFIILALKKSEPTPEVTRRHFTEVYGVQPIFYPAEGGVRAGLEKVLTALQRRDARKLERIPIDFVKGAADKPARPKPYEAWPKLSPKTASKTSQRGRAAKLIPDERAVLYVDVKWAGSDFYWVRTKLVIADPKPVKRDAVTVYLHHTFYPNHDTAKRGKDDGIYGYNFYSYGAFTIRFEFRDPDTGKKTSVKFDLAQPESFPRGFRES